MNPEANKQAWSNAKRTKFVDDDSTEAAFLFARKGLAVPLKSLATFENASDYFDGLPKTAEPPAEKKQRGK